MNKKEVINLRTTTNFKEILDKKASERLLSLSAFITQILLDSLSPEEKKEATRQEHSDEY